jgi:undecaprenyl-phosphate 4-deoxy-4-formamido-L-arabinose transferase
VSPTHQISVVVPVYRGATTLPGLFEEVARLHDEFVTDAGHRARVAELLLVHDDGPDDSDEVIRKLVAEHDWVRPVWLSRNFGQHAATLAGMASSGGDWIVTMDEDGQHDPRHIAGLLLTAAEAGAPLTYAKPSNPPPHSRARNAASRAAKAVFRVLSGSRDDFHSFRLMEGAIARSACAYVGENVYLDVALRWSCGDAAVRPLPMREEHTQVSSYGFRKLASHFWRLVLSTGTRPLRLIAVGGVLMALLGLLFALVVVVRRVTGAFDAPGWTSVMVGQLVLVGGLFVSLAALAEYVGFAVRNAIGKPLYVTAEHVDSRVLWTLQAALGRA